MNEVIKHGRELVENIIDREVSAEEYSQLVNKLKEDCPTQASGFMHSIACDAIIVNALKDNGSYVKNDIPKYTPSETPFTW